MASVDIASPGLLLYIFQPHHRPVYYGLVGMVYGRFFLNLLLLKRLLDAQPKVPKPNLVHRCLHYFMIQMLYRALRPARILPVRMIVSNPCGPTKPDFGLRYSISAGASGVFWYRVVF